ncbi:unnamed protein product [Thelazia callipaeda]|uniref:AMP-binding domain-containing protein n=1 Tax=Thelazia callipaeda TaxID=103827 RepID=A0A0N5CYM8_THECL|nr:unnamed protein product [Thelazia callipaeda]
MSVAAIPKEFLMLYVNEFSGLCDTIGNEDVMNSVALIGTQLTSYKNCLIAIDLPRHPAFVSCILSILETKNCFVCCSTADALNGYHSVKVSCIISTVSGEIEQQPMKIHSLNIYFHHDGYYSLDTFGQDKLCYLITTSGTLGSRKEILVPHSCIMPNIWDFSRRFQITTFDTILFATSCSFDPFVVEIFLAVMNGAKLLIVPDMFRSTPYKLADAIMKYGATFIQMTPSHLKILPESALVRIFSGQSSVRTMILGGEAFPMDFIQRYYTDNKCINLYNVYGVTEVSCWASCYKIDLKEERAQIGEPLMSTKFDISKTGELLIGGSRRCYVNGKLSGAWLSTGDIVECTELGRIYWCGRTDDQQKINAINVSLSELARKVEKNTSIKSALALRRGHAILLFIRTDNNINLQSYLYTKFSIPGILMIVVEIEDWPITDNGKVDRRKLMQIFEQRNLVFTMGDLRKLFAKFEINLELHQQMLFKNLGLNSLHAAEIAIKTEHLLKHHDFPVFQYLLSDTGTVAEFIAALDFHQNVQRKCTIHGKKIVIKPVENSTKALLEWEFNLGRCIDSTPVLDNGSIFLGSHSGRLISLSSDGILKWEVQLGDRIEATACSKGNTVAVGCYDGYVYFFHNDSGHLIWKFGTGDAVKSTPVLVNEGHECLLGSYDKFLYFLDVLNHKMIWKVMCNGSILSSPSLIRDIVICATLRGELLAVKMESGNMLWKLQLAAPVFANLIVLKMDRVLVVDVKGVITMFNIMNGFKMHERDLKECVFASPILFSDNSDSASSVSVVIVMSQSSSIFILRTENLKLLQHVHIDGVGSFVRAPDLLVNEGLLFIQDSSGTLLAMQGLSSMLKVCDDQLLNPKIVSILKVNEETFGGVKVVKVSEENCNSERKYYALIGSRNDRLRCFCFSLQ